MAAKAGIFDLIFKSGAKAAKEMSKGAKPAAGGVAGAAKKAPSNMKVVPPKTPTGTRGAIPRAKKYYEETGRPKIANGRPLPPSMGRPIPAKKAVPVKKAAPGYISPERAKRKAELLGGLKPREMGSAPKPAPAKKAVAALDARKAAYEKMVKKPVPVKKAVPVKKTQPYVSKPAAPAFKEPGGRTNRPTMGLKKYPPTKKPR